VSCFDDPDRFTPVEAIWTSSKSCWFSPGGIPTNEKWSPGLTKMFGRGAETGDQGEGEAGSEVSTKDAHPTGAEIQQVPTVGGSVEGGCLCGAQRFTIRMNDKEPIHPPTYCCCRMCQKCLGAPAGLYMCVDRENFTLTSTAEVKTCETWHTTCRNVRMFCSKCSAHFAFESPKDLPGMVTVAVCCFDFPDSYPPVEGVFCSTKSQWFDLGGVTGYDVWSPGLTKVFEDYAEKIKHAEETASQQSTRDD